MGRIFIILAFLIPEINCFSQSNDDTAALSATDKLFQAYGNISNKSLRFIQNKYNKLTASVEKQTEKMLRRMQQKEEKLRRKLESSDSAKAKELFAKTAEKYRGLQDQLQGPIDSSVANPLKEYIPGLDSLQTAARFLSGTNLNMAGLLADKLQQVQAISGQLYELQGRLQQANNIQQYVREREAQLKQALANTGPGKQLLSLNKEVYYYRQRLSEYKALLHDPDKLEEKLLATVRDLPAFQQFWQKNSFLALLFPMPSNSATASQQVVAGLQVRSAVQNMITQRIPVGGGMTPQQFLQQQTGEAQSQLNALKNRLSQPGGSGNDDLDMPDFKPNSQHTKSFFQRLEFGFNVQSEKSRYLLPASSDMAFTIGYKLNDKNALGFGLSYKLGWGRGWNNISLSSEGVGLRSFVDIKANGSIWITGGYEYNFFQHFSSISDIKNLDVWQRSALFGLTKKYKVGKKTGNVQLLYDFLHDKQIPESQGFKFRMGYTF